MASDERSLMDLVREAVDIDGRVERSPYLMVAGALGAGFVLGGGLFTRLTERLAGAALRVGMMAALPLVQEELGRRLRRTANGAGSQEEKGESS
jgi:hypothetical protein